MLTVVIKNDEKNVIDMTYAQLWKELQDIPGAELLVVDSWWDGLEKASTDFICFVESDCLVSSGFFASQVGIFKKDKALRKLAVLGTALGVFHWGNRFYGYSFGNTYSDGLVPQRVASSKRPYPVQVAFIPGAIIRTSMLKRATEAHLKGEFPEDNLVEFSARLCLLLWEDGTGHRIALNPNTTYVTTEKYAAEIGNFNIDTGDAMVKFTKAGIR